MLDTKMQFTLTDFICNNYTKGRVQMKTLIGTGFWMNVNKVLYGWVNLGFNR